MANFTQLLIVAFWRKCVLRRSPEPHSRVDILMETGGCGKTILSSLIINKLQGTCRTAEVGRSGNSIAYFYCTSQPPNDYGESFRTFLRTLIGQLCPPTHEFPALRELYNRCTQKHPEKLPIRQDLQDTLLSILEQLTNRTETVRTTISPDGNTAIHILEPGHTFLIIDGLDKLVPGPQRDPYLAFLKVLAFRNFKHLHVLVARQANDGS